MAELIYPIRPEPEDDPRFTFGLYHDVAAVLEQHGYPRPTGPDLVELRQALYAYLYGDRRHTTC